jgi:hypothetical protein
MMTTGEAKISLRLIQKKKIKKSGGDNEISSPPWKGLFILPLGIVDLPNLIMPFTFYTLKCREHLRTFNIAF